MLALGALFALAFFVPGAACAEEAATKEFKVSAPIVDIKTPDEGSFRVYQGEGTFRIDTGSGSSRKSFIYNNTLGTLTSVNHNTRTYIRVPLDIPETRRATVSNTDIIKCTDLKTAAQKERTAVNGAFNYKLEDMRKLSDMMFGTVLCERYTIDRSSPADKDKSIRTTVYIDKAKGFPIRITRQSSSGGQVRIFEFFYPGTPLAEGAFEPPADFARVAPLVDVVDPAVIAAEHATPGSEPKPGEAGAPASGTGDTAASSGPVKPAVKVPDNEPFLNTKPML